MGQNNTKKMVQGAMIAALFGALSLFNTYTGSMLDIFICYGMVIPLVIYGYTYDLKSNGIVCFVSMIVIAMMGIPYFVISALSSCFIGLFLGECLKRKVKKEYLLLGVFCISFLNNIMLYEVLSGLLGIDLMSEMKEMYQMMISMMPELQASLSLDALISLIPLVLMIMSALEMYVIIVLCQLVLKRFHIEFPGSFHIATMHLSFKTGIVVAIMMFGGSLMKRVYPHIIFDYMYYIGVMTFALQGLSLICFYLIMKQKAQWMILGFIGFIVPITQIIYVILGILDIFSDLRRNILYNSTYEKE